MEIFLLSLAIVGIALFGMAIGVVISNRALKGSCGGLGNIMGEDCMFCEKKEQCKKAEVDEDFCESDDARPLQIDASTRKVHLKLIE